MVVLIEHVSVTLTLSSSDCHCLLLYINVWLRSAVNSHRAVYYFTSVKLRDRKTAKVKVKPQNHWSVHFPQCNPTSCLINNTERLKTVRRKRRKRFLKSHRVKGWITVCVGSRDLFWDVSASLKQISSCRVATGGPEILFLTLFCTIINLCKYFNTYILPGQSILSSYWVKLVGPLNSTQE